MLHTVYKQLDSYSVALLIKNVSFNHQQIKTHYIDILNNKINKEDYIAVGLPYPVNRKITVTYIKEALQDILPELKALGVKTLYCADTAYFKVLTKQSNKIGYAVPCVIKGYEDLTVIQGINYSALIYNPEMKDRLLMSLDALVAHIKGKDSIFSNVIHTAKYPTSPGEAAQALKELLQYPTLTCDVETVSLRFTEANLATIAFAWNEHEGVAFQVDYVSIEPTEGVHGKIVKNEPVRQLLKEFFESYKGTLIFHNSTFDTKILIYSLWMNDPLDTEGLLTGLEIMHRSIHDTKLIAFLALNTTAEISLDLKSLAREFAGDWAQEEITNILRIPLDQLLEYNLMDCLATHYVFNKYYDELEKTNQLSLYEDLMLPSQKVITQMELTGAPMDKTKIREAREQLENDIKEAEKIIATHEVVLETEEKLTEEAWIKDYQTRKFKAKNPDRIKEKDFATFPRVTFNPNSSTHLITLLYKVLELPVIDLTKTKLPATGAKTLNRLIHHIKDESVVQLINTIIDWTQANKILTTFITAFENGIDKGDGLIWLHGSFNLPGAVSGRMTSNSPNMQNLPSGSKYGKLIKKCFVAPKGFLMAGADFNSLEDYVNALITKDRNKLRIYIDGYDSHCLRAYSYWPEKFPDIVETPESINSIKTKYSELREKSKSPTFALTYRGTYITLVKNLGFSESEAKRIEANYHKLYKESDEWIQKRLDQARIDGYVTVAFGLRIRTPLLAQTLSNSRSRPFQAEEEGRTAANAFGQSYGLLTNRAINAFMKKVWTSKYRLVIKPIMLIHDAIYLLIEDSLEVVDWVNRNLIKEMQWQELPELKHDIVKIGANLDIYYPSWADPLKLENNESPESIQAKVDKYLTKIRGN